MIAKVEFSRTFPRKVCKQLWKHRSGCIFRVRSRISVSGIFFAEEGEWDGGGEAEWSGPSFVCAIVGVGGM